MYVIDVTIIVTIILISLLKNCMNSFKKKQNLN